MPPIVQNPANNGTTNGTLFYFNQTNAHGIHPAVTLTQWKITVTTGQNNTGTVKSDTGWLAAPIQASWQVSVPGDNNFYWTQIVYTNGSGTFLSTSNKFQSLR